MPANNSHDLHHIIIYFKIDAVGTTFTTPISCLDVFDGFKREGSLGYNIKVFEERIKILVGLTNAKFQKKSPVELRGNRLDIPHETIPQTIKPLPEINHSKKSPSPAKNRFCYLCQMMQNFITKSCRIMEPRVKCQGRKSKDIQRIVHLKTEV